MRYFLLAMLFFTLTSSGVCEDRLYLSGYVVSYDRSTGITVINVATPGCEGLREFYLRSDSSQVWMEKGTIVHFYINSSQCEAGKTYEMILRKR